MYGKCSKVGSVKPWIFPRALPRVEQEIYVPRTDTMCLAAATVPLMLLVIPGHNIVGEMVINEQLRACGQYYICNNNEHIVI